MDNAATSYPKASKVSDAMKYYIDEVGASINRSSYPLAMSCGMKALTLRERACRLFNFDNISGDDAEVSDTADLETSEQTPDEGDSSFDFNTDFDDTDFKTGSDPFDGLGELSELDVDKSGSSDDDILRDVPEAPEAGELPEEPHGDTALSGTDDSSNFDNMLSSFDFDPEPIKVNERAKTDDTIPEDVETLDEHDEVPGDEDTFQEEHTIPDITVPDALKVPVQDLRKLDSSQEQIDRCYSGLLKDKLAKERKDRVSL